MSDSWSEKNLFEEEIKERAIRKGYWMGVNIFFCPESDYYLLE